MRRFVADASPELRTPLTSIRGHAELYCQGATSPDEIARGMERIEREAARMAALVDDLLLRDHIDPGTTATVTLAGGAGTAKLTVADNGLGMSSDEAAHALERFWQAETTAGHPRRGTGPGLAIVAELVAAHRGTITLDTSPGPERRSPSPFPRPTGPRTTGDRVS